MDNPATRPVLAKYLRLSLEDGSKGESNSIQTQRELLDQYLSTHPEFTGWDILEFIDDGWSGTHFQRPGVQTLLDLARRRRLNCIIVKDISRLGRNYKEVGALLEQLFPFQGIRFISLNDHYDSAQWSGTTGGLQVSLRALLYDWYSRDISVKVRSARLFRVRQGDYCCTFAPYGYQKSRFNPHRLAVDEVAAAVVRQIFAMAKSGASTTEIARTLNRQGIPSPLVYKRRKHQDRTICAHPDNFWNNHAVLDILKRPCYTGTAIGRTREVVIPGQSKVRRLPPDQWHMTPNCHEPLVSPEDFAEIQARIAHPKRQPMHKPSAALFQGLLTCAGCGRPLQRSHTHTRYYTCQTPSFGVCTCNCLTGRLMEGDLTDTVTACIRQFIGLSFGSGPLQEWSRTHNAARISTCTQLMKTASDSMRHWNGEKLALFEQYYDGRISCSDYFARRDNADQKYADCEAQYQRLQAQIVQLKTACQDCQPDPTHHPYERWPPITRALVDLLIKRINVYAANRIEVIWKCQDLFSPRETGALPSPAPSALPLK